MSMLHVYLDYDRDLGIVQTRAGLDIPTLHVTNVDTYEFVIYLWDVRGSRYLMNLTDPLWGLTLEAKEDIFAPSGSANTMSVIGTVDTTVSPNRFRVVIDTSTTSGLSIDSTGVLRMYYDLVFTVPVNGVGRQVRVGTGTIYVREAV